jgi:putative molybdopterin biosynthesis protein
MSIYLHDIPLPEAQSRLQQALEEAGLWRVLEGETIPLDENARGRVSAEPIWAKISSPHYHAAAMDGFAVKAEETLGAQPSTPLELAVINASSAVILARSSKYVDTGDPLPEWANAVIPIENVEPLDERGQITSIVRRPESIRIRAGVAPWSHVRPMGEDIIATQLVLPAGHVLRPVDLGAIAAAGYSDIRVVCRPRVALLPTGTELVSIGSKLKPGDILEYNSVVLAAQLESMGSAAKRFPITKDDFDLICQRVQEAVRDNDLILLIAGSSAGAEDFSAKVVEKLGTLLVHGVAVRPGHPVILGIIPKNGLKKQKKTGSNIDIDLSNSSRDSRKGIVPIIGVPGYPVSAVLTIDIFVEPLIAKWLGRRASELPTETAMLTRKIVSPAGDEDYVRVAVGKVGGKLLAAPLARGAGVITSMVHADGLVILPRGVQGIEAGDQVPIHLYRSSKELERTIFCIGSHDLTLDLLAQYLADHGRRLVSANVGSQGGLVALGRGEAHLAGSHLLDPKTGEYNVHFVKQYLPNVHVNIVALVKRQQGLLIRRGNPKNVKNLNDLTRSDVHFVNRQRGAGTRVLLDYHLDRMGINAALIQGYNQEEYTHLGVAAAVASGRADCGLGIAAAAQALELDFIPFFEERYDLVIPKEFAESELLKPLFIVLAQKDFQSAVAALPGYDVSLMGKLISEK